MFCVTKKLPYKVAVERQRGKRRPQRGVGELVKQGKCSFRGAFVLIRGTEPGRRWRLGNQPNMEKKGKTPKNHHATLAYLGGRETAQTANRTSPISQNG